MIDNTISDGDSVRTHMKQLLELFVNNRILFNHNYYHFSLTKVIIIKVVILIVTPMEIIRL